VTCERITTDPDVMAGLPCIRGLRFPVATVVEMVADGMTADEILAEHPDLTTEPSVLLIRRLAGRRAAEQSAIILANLDQIAEELTAGAAVVIGDDWIRIRRLPMPD
jgi:uncharacterized protein (DUF433 family)